MCYLFLYNSSNNNNNNSVLTTAVFIGLMLLGPSKCLKKLIQIELNRVSERPAVH